MTATAPEVAGSNKAAVSPHDALEDPSVAEVDDVAAACQTQVAHGLTAATAALRLARDGANELRSVPPVPRWRRALAQLQDPLVYLLLVAAAVALAAWLIEGRPGWPMDAIVIAVVVVLNAVLGWVQETKAQSAVAALARMTQATSSVVRDGQLIRIPSAALVLGDVLVLSEGDGDLTRARTAGFTVLVLAQLFNCFNARSETRSAFHGLLANPRLWATVVLSAVLQVAGVHLEFLNRAFGTAPLSLAQRGVCLAMASGVLWFSELRKWGIRAFGGGTHGPAGLVSDGP